MDPDLPGESHPRSIEKVQAVPPTGRAKELPPVDLQVHEDDRRPLRVGRVLGLPEKRPFPVNYTPRFTSFPLRGVGRRCTIAKKESL